MASLAKSFGSEVRKQRESLGLSQEKFAEKAGIHRTYVSSIELGKVDPSLSVANKLAVALDVKLSEIIQSAEE
ncbi:MAG: helix-turn-helix transcriptional regulator [Actinobacteria bacterium]|nr:helix-turn-helix transcriptional regulator [Actinomycetota bacterium]